MKSKILVVGIIVGIAVLVAIYLAFIIGANTWAWATTYPVATSYPSPGAAVGICPMAAGWGYGGYIVNDGNVVEYVAEKTGYKVLDVEKYEYNYYVIVGDADGRPVAELLVYSNGLIHPEPQSMMWRGEPMRLSLNDAYKIAESWLAQNFPGAEIVENYTFPGYYTFHFMWNGDMQMLSVNAYNGAVWFHTWHGRYLGEIEVPNGSS
ncbi:MAG: hypothetical protein QXP98_08400 [Thermoproteus sp.]